MIRVIVRFILLLLINLKVINTSAAVAVIKGTQGFLHHDQDLQIEFSQENTNRPVFIRGIGIQETYSVEWEIHDLPLKMGSGQCSELELGSCFKCHMNTNEDDNIPIFKTPVQIKGNSLSDMSLPECAQIQGKNGIVGRSLVLKLKKGNQKELVFCANIYDAENMNPRFMSAIAWFDQPLAGFVAFRKESLSTSYIIVNLTRTSDNYNRPEEKLKWEIRTNINNRDFIYNPDNTPDIRDPKYRDNCQHSETGHLGCVPGDLWRKHDRLELGVNPLGINLRMYIDNNLDPVMLTSTRETDAKYLVIFNESNTNASSENIIAWSKIQDLQPISTETNFMDGTVLKMLQRDAWSPIEHHCEPANRNVIGKWVVKVYTLPPIQIFGGDQTDCTELTSKGWSTTLFLPPFKTSLSASYLNQSYSLYGRNSMMYRGISITQEGTSTSYCATITYKPSEERIAYAKLVPLEKSIDQRVIFLVIEHVVLRQTTTLLATLCRTNQFFLEMTESETCESSTEPFNPYGVCPAYCPMPDVMRCERQCPNRNSHGQCCTLCVYDSSYLCPVGDFLRRLGAFNSVQRIKYTNRETVFSVKNDVNLPLSQMVDKSIGQKVYLDDVYHSLSRCGKVQELPDTVLTFDKKDGLTDGRVTLTQKAAWQPINVAWEGIELISLKFRNQPTFPNHQYLCPTDDLPPPDDLYKETFSGSGTYFKNDKTLKKEDRSPTFFGRSSVLYKSLVIEYKTKAGTREETVVNMRPNWSNNATKLQAVLKSSDSQRVLKFDFIQRTDHLTADTYVIVEVLSREFCSSIFKWYIISNKSVRSNNYKKGDKFLETDVTTDDERIVHSPKEQDCTVNRLFPANLRMGDLSAMFDNVNMEGGPGKIFIHSFLPLIQVNGSILLLADSDDFIIGLIEIEEAQTNDVGSVVEPVKGSTPVWVIVVCVIVGLVVMCITALIWKRCLGQGGTPTPSNLDRQANSANVIMTKKHRYESRITGMHKIVDVDYSDRRLYKVLATDPQTGERKYVHLNELHDIGDGEAGHHVVDSNGSTNGSSPSRSRGSANMEENVYSTLSPISTLHPYLGVQSPESSNSSLASST